MALNSVQRLPSGLLELFGLRGTGDFPRSLAEAYVGTLNVKQLVARTNLTASFLQNAALPPATSITITVPDAQVWLVCSAFVRIVQQVAMTTVRTQIGYGTPSASSPIDIKDHVGPFVAGAIMGHCKFFQEPLVLTAGDRITCAFMQLSGVANADVTLNVQFGLMT